MRCSECKFWDIANAIVGSPDKTCAVDGWRSCPDEGHFYKPPHANLRWAKCSAALEGWGDGVHELAPKMAVWDGSAYYAELLTRDDHICGEFQPRPTTSAPAPASPDLNGKE